MINPTGGAIRNDKSGDGRYGSSRGYRKHKGTDYVGVPGQRVWASISGKITRSIRVYKDTPDYRGLEIVGKHMTVKMLYINVDAEIIGEEIEEGDYVGIMQDVTKYYNWPQPGDQPHVHLEVVSINPEYLIYNNELINGA